MATLEKKPKSAKRQKKKAAGIPDIENPEIYETSLKQEAVASLPGSVISVKDADVTEKAENLNNGKVENENAKPPKGKPEDGSKNNAQEDSSKPTVSRVPSAVSKSKAILQSETSRPSSANSRNGNLELPLPIEFASRPGSAGLKSASVASFAKKNQVEPANVLKPGSNMGSAVSLQSKISREAWNEPGDVNETSDNPLRPLSATSKATAKTHSRHGSAAASVMSVNEADNRNKSSPAAIKESKPIEIIPADMNEAHAYVPYMYARDCISKMMDDMKNMKKKHITIINDIEENYQYIEKETQGQFNTFVIGLRQQYGNKVKTFRQVIEVHRTELGNKEQYWDEALMSLSNKNKQLLQDKKALLIQNKIDAENAEKQKEEELKDLVDQLDDRNKAFVLFEKEKNEEVYQKVESSDKEKQDIVTKVEEEKENLQKECDEEVEKLRGENKILNDELENEKTEKQRLQAVLDDLKTRPETAAAVTTAIAFKRSKTPVDKKTEESVEQSAAIPVMSDMSSEEREEIKRERERMEKDRHEFIEDRKHFQEERIIIHGDLSNAQRDQAVWKAKYDGLKNSVGEYDDWKKRYDMLLAQYEAVTAVAQVNTTEEKAKAEEEIKKTDEDKVIMVEEQQKLNEDIKKWEDTFQKKNGRPPTENDRTDSTSEMYKSKEEADDMVNKLQAQLLALEALKRGEIPKPPEPEKETIVIKEKEVTTVEVKVQDPELLAYVEMTQAELEAMRKQLMALKNDKTDLRGQIEKLEATNKDLENRLRMAANGEQPMVPTPKQDVTTNDVFCQTDPLTESKPNEPVKSEPVEIAAVDTEAIEKLEKQLREKDKEIRELELTQKDALRLMEKDKNALEKDLKKALKALDKAMKSGISSKEDKKLKNLLDIVVAQVCEINTDVNKAALEVDKRLKSAENKQKKSADMKTRATDQYKEWEVGWAEENGRDPGLNDVEADKDAYKLYKIMKAANKKGNEDDLLLEALTLIKTGALPEKKDEEKVEEKQQQSPIVQAAAVPDNVAPCNHEEEIERLENTVSNLEKKIDEIQDQVRDLESQRDLLTNENKDLEDRIADLLAEIERLRRQVDFHKQKEQEIHKQMQEERSQHEQDMREQEREHQKQMEEKEEEYRKEKQEMESDIKKLVKLIDKLKKKMAQKAKDAKIPQNELEQQLRDKDDELDELDEALNDLEDKNHDLENDKQHLKDANRKLEEKIAELETVVTKTETTVTELGGANSAAESAEAENRQLKDELDALRRKIKELEQDVRVKSKELREMEYEHEKEIRDKEREVKEVKNDIEKVIKLCDKLRRQVKDDKNTINSLEKEANDILKDCHEKDQEIDDLIEKLNEGEKEQKRIERAKPKKEKEDDVEEIITELKTKVTFLEDNAQQSEVKAHDFEADYNLMKASNKELEDEVDELQEELASAQNRIADLEALAGASEMLDKAQDELANIRKKLKNVEADLRDKEKEFKDKNIEMKEQKNEYDRSAREKELIEREMKNDIKKLLKQIEKLKKQLKTREAIKTGPNLVALNEKDEEVAQMEKDLEKAEDKAQELEYKVADLQTENKHIQQDIETAKNEKEKLEAKLHDLKEELEKERDMAPITQNISPPMAASTPTRGQNLDVDLEDLTLQIEKLQKQVDQTEGEVRQEKEAHQVTKDELDALKRQLNEIKVELENQEHEAAGQFEGMKEKKETEIDNLKKKLSEMRKRNEELEHHQINALPPDAAKEIKKMKALVVASEKELDNKEVEKADLSSKVRELIAKIKSLENSSKNQKTHGTDAEIKLKNLRQEKDKEIKHLQVQAEKKEIERALQEKKKISALEQKIRALEAGAPKATGKAVEGKADPKALKDVQDKLREAKREIADLNTRNKQLEKATAKPAASGESDLKLKKQEKLSQELMKKLDDAQKKNKKNEENLSKQVEDIKDLEKNNTSKDKEIEKLKAELAALGVAAKAGIESEQRKKELEKEVKELHHETKTIQDSWNQERVLRKKYYNMVEDMKGKIRVYARARPISKAELDRGNVEVTKSPDEYTIQVETQRGHKEWQFDQIFMPDSTQEKVFEDTNNLIQSAVDGYNVCIFAYGQTGSGKTFTIIGDREQQFPGIAPRAFNRVFDLLNENKAKFSFSVSCYMLELYNDKLLDLLAKPGHGSDDKLEIKKDKKGMVHVQGAEVKAARNAKELYALFDEGSVNRHTASTQMNAESSRSHLVISIIIETTNKATGQIVKGKLSLVDLAGSERAAKTNAGAEQLKEAMSINKSLSALGDVISALSSEQSFIPYRNNKLTMLMQDSLGGNAKTLMFVNVSPVDYNADESAISLTYASRVKLITNDAQKNSDNKEIARLKAVVAKLKIGSKLTEEEEQAADDAQQQ